MRKALLIYNPSSGRRKAKRAQQISQALAVIRSAGVDAESSPTTYAGSASSQAREAVVAGFDTVIACGGDGTANEVLNGLMGAGGEATMGVLPFGSANLLATDLLLPPSTEAAARVLLRYQPCAIQPGLMRYQDKATARQRYFIVAAGVGSDAELMYRTAVRAKERFGMYAYILEMFRMAARRGLHKFKVEWNDEAGRCQSAEAAMVLAVRASKFPGLLKRVQLGSELLRNDYRLLLFRTNKVRHFLNYFASVCSGLNWRVPQVELVYSKWFRCTPLAGEDQNPIRCEVDGELLGTVPVEVSIELRTFNLLMPKRQ